MSGGKHGAAMNVEDGRLGTYAICARDIPPLKGQAILADKTQVLNVESRPFCKHGGI